MKTSERLKAMREASLNDALRTDAPTKLVSDAVERVSSEVLRSHNGVHVYLSTPCVHGKHKLCRLVCKFCPSECICECHGKVQVEAPEAPAKKSKWPQRKKRAT